MLVWKVRQHENLGALGWHAIVVRCCRVSWVRRETTYWVRKKTHPNIWVRRADSAAVTASCSVLLSPLSLFAFKCAINVYWIAKEWI